ncbi:MAG: GNVR domain-containing protein, partial [Fibrobacterota bacterium]
LMASGRVPEMGMEYLRKLRQLKYNETLYELLSKQYELAKLEEARDAVVIQVIDRAVPPERKSSPKRGAIIVVSTILGFLLSAWFLSVMEVRKADRAERQEDRIERKDESG